MEKMIKKIKNLKYKQHEHIYNVDIILSTNRIFLLEDSLPNGITPTIGDKILWDFEVNHFVITDIEHLINPIEQKFYNYALKVDLP